MNSVSGHSASTPILMRVSSQLAGSDQKDANPIHYDDRAPQATSGLYRALRAGDEVTVPTNAVAAEMLAKDRPSTTGYTFAMGCAEQETIPAFMKRIAVPGGVIVAFGESGSCKSFVMIDFAGHLATGRNWCGYKVPLKVGVLVVLGEGQGGYRKRLRAWAKARDIDPAEVALYVYPNPVDLHSGPAELANAITEAESALGCNIGVILIDTYVTCIGDGDEQSNSDASRIFRNGKAAAGPARALAFVHHVGHGDKGRERGAYNIRANVDVRFLIERSGEVLTMTCLKEKDDAELDQLRFVLRQVDLGVDEDGDAINSLVVDPTDRMPTKKAKKTEPTAKNQKIVWGVIGELLQKSHDRGKGGAPTCKPCVAPEAVIESCKGRLLVEPKRLRERVGVAINGMVADGFLKLSGDWLWIP